MEGIMDNAFNHDSLPCAVRSLFELNNYEVDGPLRIHGAEIDLLAKPLSDPFGSAIYIEVTTEYVDNEKYGNDLTKLAIVREKDPTARGIIVSSSGFSVPVQERAKATRIETLTYTELFRRFERFDKYIRLFEDDTEMGIEYAMLDKVYEEPYFEDKIGKHKATEYLSAWRDDATPGKSWLIIVGEYGSGKTALTKILQYRWLRQYRRNPMLALPLRIELRNFARQFDARGLLHHFLDRNNMGHLPVEYVISLIRKGRIILLLDGYDEMAQYLHARERRACLEALAELSAGGAKGLVTSRPNYFTQGEELQVFEVLYSSLQNSAYYLGREALELVEREKAIDSLLARFLDKYERALKELSPEQTESLVNRVLQDDIEGRRVVLALLRRIFRSMEHGDAVTLSGKPVIITYLLEIVEGLKKGINNIDTPLKEAGIFSLIVDQLMMRDLARSPEIDPRRRRRFLRRMAILLSRRDTPAATEKEFRDMVMLEFNDELRRAGEAKPAQIERYFADLRGSATLTRSVDDHGVEAWRFSHNSLREYLVFEQMMDELRAGNISKDKVPITDAMRMFASSLTEKESREYIATLAAVWKASYMNSGRGRMLCLIWGSLFSIENEQEDPLGEALKRVAGAFPDVRNAEIVRLNLSSESEPAMLSHSIFSGSVLVDVSFEGANLECADFTNASLDGVSFENANLRSAQFKKAFLSDINIAGATLKDADFREISADNISVLSDSASGKSTTERYEGLDALGLIGFKGGLIDRIPNKLIWRFHPRFTVIEKIIEKLAEQRLRQYRGLVQRGAATRDVALARRLLEHLESLGLVSIPYHRKELVETTEKGREIFISFVRTNEMPAIIGRFVESELLEADGSEDRDR